MQRGFVVVLQLGLAMFSSVAWTYDKDNVYSGDFLGFSVYISNTTNKKDGVLCFRDTIYTRATIPNPINITCPYHGRYVIYYNNRTHPPYPDGYSTYAYNDICEVEVYGCPKQGYYGENCAISCPENCVNGMCHIVNGTCFGCAKGFTGTVCDKECDNHTFGGDCSLTCGNCVNKERCNHVDGSCPNGCDSGSFGRLCDKECPNGLYGHDCQKNCSANCGVQWLCDRETGSCIHACQRGWKGDTCMKECDGGFFGHNCAESCGECFEKEQCHHVNGSCLKGCAYGYSGIHCKDIEANGYRGSTFPNVHAYANVNGMWELPAAIEQSEFHIQEEISDRLEHSEELSFLSTENALNVKHFQVKFKSDIQIHEPHAFSCANGSGFKGEFALLPVGEYHSCFVGKRKENTSKNRYKKIFPYDHSRVVLKTDIDYSDYINANYIKDTDGNIGYIATQGPKHNTINDFWRMIWQENVTQIVMLTNLMEDGKIKCSQYWPESTDEEYYGDFNISKSKSEEIHFAFYVIRKFTMSNSEGSRVVTQYHYTKWPDHGTPDPFSLLLFHSHVLRTRTAEFEAPTIVHCSAGIGRTGTYIAFDALCKEGQSKGTINVASYVKVMRSCRMNMVQTYEQYKTIYLALNEEFKAPVRTKSISAFRESMQHFFREDPSDHIIFQKELKSLSDIKPACTKGDFRDVTLHTVNTEEENLLQLDRYNLYLTPTVYNRGNYIRALYSFLEENAFIVTQYPSENGAVDFLRMLIDNDSDTVICMDPLAEIESSTAWLPEPSLYKLVGPYSLQHEGGSEIDVKVTSVKILDGTESTHSIKIVQPTGSLKSIQYTACLRSLVSYAVHISTENPVTIVSKDGESLCGVFCAVFNCIQQINMDESVDVFTTVRQLQTRRPEFCSTLGEYMLVYKSVKDFIEFTSEHVYSNQ
uniref:protein-tyrosine-phosphatase n=1 Tax=Crassostrea virginica TaxID=6565 RepID=A0A8B8BWK5_CRAVI|nr:receptor-type tyrosine-protein phosphatase alpha-like [Crassostrea virginica]